MTARVVGNGVVYARGEFPNGQYVDKNNCMLRVRDGNEWERTGKPLKPLGGCNFRKGKYLAFCR
jgi:hypothetical protein